MTERGKRRPVAVAGVAMLAALALAGCSATHVGDDWQCPLAQGEVCASVAAADPAVRETRVSKAELGRNPAIMHARAGAPGTAGTDTATAIGASKCDTDCDPLGWLADLFVGIAEAGSGDGEHAAVDEDRGSAATAAPVPDAHVDAGTAGFPAVPTVETFDGTADAKPPESEWLTGNGLREPETIGRIWIAPFVDADGVYREGAWVRVVIAPAEWRLP